MNTLTSLLDICQALKDGPILLFFKFLKIFIILACRKESPGEFAKVSMSLWLFERKYPDILLKQRRVSVTEIRLL